jgi:hypothetical protein
MFSEQVRLQIEANSRRMLTSSPLLQRARQGRIVPSVVHGYLRSLHYIISHTVPHLQAARKTAIARGNLELAVHFELKEREETGHEAWAESDMRRLAQCFGDIGQVTPSPSIVGLARFIERLIDEDPRLYVAYVLCVEYFTVLLGPAWIDALTGSCGVPATALTVVSKHVEADAEHAREGFDALERFAAALELQPRVLLTVDAVFDYFARWSHDLMCLSQASSVALGSASMDTP